MVLSEKTSMGAMSHEEITCQNDNSKLLDSSRNAGITYPY
jgi:hypothetical protein